MHSTFLVLPIVLFFSSSIEAQFYYHQPAVAASYQQPQYQPAHYHAAAAHPSVVRNAMWESELPPELRKSDKFYNNPRIAAALAKESWLTDKEMAVVDREAEKIPREMVYKIFKNAGWVRRR